MGCTSSKESSPSHLPPKPTTGGAPSSSPTNTTTTTTTNNNNNNNNNDTTGKHQPMKKVQTSFSDVNYSDPSSGRSDTAYAPSEVAEAQRPSVVGEVPLTSVGGEELRVGKGAVGGDEAGNGGLGARVGAGGKGEKDEVAWDALSPGSTPGPGSAG